MFKHVAVADVQETAGLSRRALLQAGLVGACALLTPCAAWAAAKKEGTTDLKAAGKTPAAPAAPAPAAPEPNYYMANKAKFLADFKGVCGGAEKWLAARVAGPIAKATSDDALRRFEILLPGLPDLGGMANRNQPFITMAGWLTALTLALREKGLTAKDAGRLLYDLYAADWAAVPPAKAQAMGAALFSPAAQASLKQWAENTQKRLLPGDWVVREVTPDKTFDVGYDYLECGAVKYFKAQGVADVAPYYCLNDFLASRAQGTGLARQHTIAQGDPLCDFRYKRGRAVTQDWNTEVPKFKV
jgi:hypothetical protein